MGAEIIGVDLPAITARLATGLDTDVIRELIKSLERGTLEGIAERKERESG